MSKKLSEMTIDELRALPVYEHITYDVYVVRQDGTVKLPNGRIIRGLRGTTLRVPRMQRGYCMLYGPDDPVFWWDEKGEDAWCATMSPNGLARRRFPWI
jgi:hypothetical protein